MDAVIEIRGGSDFTDNNGKQARSGFLAVFGDGTKLKVIAIIPNMPSADMTPREIPSLNALTGELTIKSDNGFSELWQLQDQTSAMKMLREIEKRVKELTE